ncbi:MAG: murein biosynthesis integral membrane protein MurJ [Candidatus Omnitrophica bacterium]|nr:murein biosynthesis integral membrane protein MurJ [Candidatus Omnitrophota bacterium]MDD5671971.1 murein biosynthesis integral membrane protein MurJ [Candidatus Omnitrophota bacterium]
MSHKPLSKEDHSKTRRHLVKATGLIGILTLVSRVLGLIRDIVSARSFGTSWQWDAFIYAFQIPNFFRRLVGEGALSPAFIPVYSECFEQKGKEMAFRFANVTMTFLAVMFTVFLIVLEISLSFLTQAHFLSPTLRMVTDLLRYFFPYLWLMSLFALGMGVLNSHKHFLAPSLGSIIMDIFWIAGVLWLVPLVGSDQAVQVRWLAVVVLISGIVQLFAELPPLYKMGFRVTWIFDLKSAELKKMFRLLMPAILGFAVVQLNILVDMTCGLMIGPGANSSLWYGNRLMQFPLGMFAVAMGTALLPTIAAQAARRELDAARQTLQFALKCISLIALPSSIGLMILGKPIIQFLFQHGQFDAVSTARTSAVLFFYTLGLFAYSCQRMIATGFYAIQDTRTPVRVAVVALLINIVLNIVLMVPMREAGLALATSISGIYQFLALVVLYQRKVARLDMRDLLMSLAKIVMATIAMGAVCFAIDQCFGKIWPSGNVIAMGIRIFANMMVSTLAYIGFCFVLRIEEMRKVKEWMFKKSVPQSNER